MGAQKNKQVKKNADNIYMYIWDYHCVSFRLDMPVPLTIPATGDDGHAQGTK